MTVRAMTSTEIVEALEDVRGEISASAAYLRRAGMGDVYLTRHAVGLEDAGLVLDAAIGNLRIGRGGEE